MIYILYILITLFCAKLLWNIYIPLSVLWRKDGSVSMHIFVEVFFLILTCVLGWIFDVEVFVPCASSWGIAFLLGLGAIILCHACIVMILWVLRVTKKRV